MHQLELMSRAVEGYEEARPVIKVQGSIISVLIKFLTTCPIYLLTADQSSCCIGSEVKVHLNQHAHTAHKKKIKQIPAVTIWWTVYHQKIIPWYDAAIKKVRTHDKGNNNNNDNDNGHDDDDNNTTSYFYINIIRRMSNKQVKDK